MEASLRGIMFYPGYINSLADNLNRNIQELPDIRPSDNTQIIPKGVKFLNAAKEAIEKVRWRAKRLCLQSIV